MCHLKIKFFTDSADEQETASTSDKYLGKYTTPEGLTVSNKPNIQLVCLCRACFDCSLLGCTYAA